MDTDAIAVVLRGCRDLPLRAMTHDQLYLWDSVCRLLLPHARRGEAHTRWEERAAASNAEIRRRIVEN